MFLVTDMTSKKASNHVSQNTLGRYSGKREEMAQKRIRKIQNLCDHLPWTEKSHSTKKHSYQPVSRYLEWS